MLEEIVTKYKEFHDTLISEINYKDVNLWLKNKGKKTVTVCMHSFNYKNEQWEKIKLTFVDVVKFRFFESTKINSTVIFEAFINKSEDLIVFDFFALQVDGRDKLAEDPNSDFVIHCKEIKYELINYLITRLMLNNQ